MNYITMIVKFGKHNYFFQKPEKLQQFFTLISDFRILLLQNSYFENKNKEHNHV